MAALVHQKCGFQHYFLDHCSFLLVFCKLVFWFNIIVAHYIWHQLVWVVSCCWDSMDHAHHWYSFLQFW
jgi:hypothetical protein